jgi:enoyl-CoA hydratase
MGRAVTDPGADRPLGGGSVVTRPADGVSLMTFDRPPVNAFDPAGYDAAARALRDLDDDAGTRALVLTGTGARAFTAGTDRASLRLSGAELDAAFASARRFFSTLAGLGTPIVGALNGPTIGGGVIIAAHCDVLLATPETYFALPELTLGYPGGGSHLMLLFPRSVALRLLLLGERLTAQQARDLGIVQVVHPAGLVPAAVQTAVAIAALDPLAVRQARSVVLSAANRNALNGYLAEMRSMEGLMTTDRQAGGER